MNLENQKQKLKEEYETKLQNEINEFKKNLNNKNDNDSLRISSERNELENEYYNALNMIKTTYKNNQSKTDEVIKNLIEKSSLLFDEIINKQNKKVDITQKDINQNLKEILKANPDNEKNCLQFEDFLVEKITREKMQLNKLSSFVDMTENDYKSKKFLLEYFIEISKIMRKIITDKKSNNLNEYNNDDSIIKDIIVNSNNTINNFRLRYDAEYNNKLYPMLYNSFQKLMNLLFNDTNTNNMIDNSIYCAGGLNPVNNNISMNNDYFRMNQTVLNDNNNNQNVIIDNNKTVNMNQTLNMQGGLNPLSSKRNYNNNNNILNKTFSNTFRSNYNMNPINEDLTNLEESLLDNNVNMNNIDIPQLPSNVVLNNECLRMYKLITEFLLNESKKIQIDINKYNRKKNENTKLSMLKESGEFPQYNNIFNQIYEEENNKSNQNLKDIQRKSEIFEIIKNNTDENFKFILNFPNRNDIISSKLKVLLTHIEDYNKNFYSKNNNYSSTSSDIIGGMSTGQFSVRNFNNSSNKDYYLNNTLNIDLKSIRNNMNIDNNINNIVQNNMLKSASNFGRINENNYYSLNKY